MSDAVPDTMVFEQGGTAHRPHSRRAYVFAGILCNVNASSNLGDLCYLFHVRRPINAVSAPDFRPPQRSRCSDVL